MSKKTRLELTWIGKDERPKLEPRILVEDQSLSYHAGVRKSEADIFDNILIQGDNLLALKALEAEYAGQVKCVFIDPPYNTGSAFAQFDDGIEHSLWLTLMRNRVEAIYHLLRSDGSFWVTLDDNEVHYFKVMCDEIFGRDNFIANIVWQKKFAPQANAIGLSDSHDHVLVYAKSLSEWRWNLLSRSADADSRYSNPDNDPRGPWMSDNFTISLTGGARGAQFARTGTDPNIYELVTPSGRALMPTRGRCWGASKERFEAMVQDNRIWFGRDGNNVPRVKRFLSEVQSGMIARTWWPRDEVGDNQESKREVARFNSEEIFSTPKPERLASRIIEIATNEGDIVLDSFAGSGTTGAVAHKMRRRWIMVELGDHAVSHIVPRLRKVIEGDDPGGVTDAAGWKGGGGFRFYRLAPSLLEKDRFGNWVIAKEYNAAMLAEAMCKHLGFTYAPSQDPAEYWRHGHSTETDFIYVTTQSLTYDALKKLSEEVGPKRTLLVCCKAFNAREDSFPNLTVKKIPHAILKKCEWGRDDYSLQIANLPEKEEPSDIAEPVATEAEKPKRGKTKTTLPLFDEPGGK
jgi:adenine-specific DNA-methyltransferase